MTRSASPRRPPLLLAILALSVLVALPAAAQEAVGYSYVRTLEGSATLFQAAGERSPAELHQPILTGERVWVSPGSRLEVVLADGSLLRLGSDSEVTFDRLAGSSDAPEPASVVRLVRGELQLVVPERIFAEELPRIDTANVTLYAQEAGTFTVEADDAGWTRAVARSGSAEVLTPSGSVVLRAGEEAVVDGATSPRITVETATRASDLERWGDALAAEAGAVEHVDPALAYQAAPLEEHGRWVEADEGVAWRPMVAGDWRPYTVGTWSYTPSGLFWVSGEPWGWVTYHYGAWDYVPIHGWVWYPAATFAPAWVYWYWGPEYVGWCPVGYYRSFYRPHYAHWRPGLHFGLYGWAGGHWGLFADWNFVHHGYFGKRHQRHHVRSGKQYLRDRRDRLDRGIITTDTRGVTPERWDRPHEVIGVLQKDRGVDPRRARLALDLPDVTPFVARDEVLPAEVETRVFGGSGEGRPDRGDGPVVLPWRGTDTSGRRLAGGGGEEPSTRLRALPVEPLEHPGRLAVERVTARDAWRRDPAAGPGGRTGAAEPSRGAPERIVGRHIERPVERPVDRPAPTPSERPSERPPDRLGTAPEPRPAPQPDTVPRGLRPEDREHPVGTPDWRRRPGTAPTRSGEAGEPPVRRVLDGIRSWREREGGATPLPRGLTPPTPHRPAPDAPRAAPGTDGARPRATPAPPLARPDTDRIPGPERASPPPRPAPERRPIGTRPDGDGAGGPAASSPRPRPTSPTARPSPSRPAPRPGVTRSAPTRPTPSRPSASRPAPRRPAASRPSGGDARRSAPAPSRRPSGGRSGGRGSGDDG